MPVVHVEMCYCNLCLFRPGLIVPIVLPDRHWNEQILDEACRLILKEIAFSGSASGEKVDYKKTLIVSFFYRFFLEVLQSLTTMVNYFFMPAFVQANESCGLFFFLCVDACNLYNVLNIVFGVQIYRIT